MSGATHTPGPWMVLPSVVPSQFVILTAEGPRRDIACTYGFGHDPREANARLIAAAPDLLVTLCAARAALAWYPAHAVVLQTIDAAIAKATQGASHG